MNTTYGSTKLDIAAIATTRTTVTDGFATVFALARGSAKALRTARRQISALTDERRRRRTMRCYRHARAGLDDGGFRFDPHRDDIFARG